MFTSWLLLASGLRIEFDLCGVILLLIDTDFVRQLPLPELNKE